MSLANLPMPAFLMHYLKSAELPASKQKKFFIDRIPPRMVSKCSFNFDFADSASTLRTTFKNNEFIGTVDHNCPVEVDHPIQDIEVKLSCYGC